MSLKQPPREFETLRDEILARYPRLSCRLQQVAQFALEHPNDMALQTIAMLARRCGVPASTLIRFAKALDYRGFSDMQAVFRLPLSDGAADMDKERRRLSAAPGGAPPAAVAVLEDAVAADHASLKRLLEALPPQRLEQAVDLLATRRTLYVTGQRWSFAAAAYLACALTHLGRPVHLLDGVGGMLLAQADGIGGDDLLIVVNSRPYSLEMVELASRAADKGAAVVAIVDSPLNPIAGVATVCLEVPEGEAQALPSLAATLCLVRALAVSAGLEGQRPHVQEPDRLEAG